LQKFDHNTVFLRKNANFFAENWQKSQKIVIITSTPGLRKLNSLASDPNKFAKMSFKEAVLKRHRGSSEE
jgi:hypothetical protein